MSVPASLLQYAESHSCFTGSYRSDFEILACLDPAQPLEPLAVISCEDCLARFAAPRSLLPHGVSSYWLADSLSQHVRNLRGFTFSFGGYHTQGPGFWLSAAYYGSSGLMLINGERSRKLGSDLDLLILALQNAVTRASDPRMLDPSQYQTQTVYVNFSSASGAIRNKNDFLASPVCRLQPHPGFQRVTLAEFLPVSAAPRLSAAASPHLLQPSHSAPPLPAASASLTPPAPSPRPLAAKPKPVSLKPGDICPVCGAEVRERWLLNVSFIGCLC